MEHFTRLCTRVKLEARKMVRNLKGALNKDVIQRGEGWVLAFSKVHCGYITPQMVHVKSPSELLYGIAPRMSKYKPGVFVPQYNDFHRKLELMDAKVGRVTLAL